MMDKETTQKIVERLKDIPTLPTVIHKIIEIVDSPTTSASDLNKAISLDQSLSAKVLKLVNSAFYGFPKKIETLTQAIVILGFNTVRSLALSISMVDFLTTRSNRVSLNYTEFWKHSIGVSILSRTIARKAFPQIAEEAFVAGLLHDIGILILDQYMPSEFVKVLEASHEQKLPLYQVEREIIGTTHCEVGRLLAAKWNLPDSLLYSIAYHHDPSPARDMYPITATVHAANIGAKLMRLGGTGDEDYTHIYQLSEDARHVLRLSFDYPEDIQESVKKAMAEGEQFISTMTGK